MKPVVVLTFGGRSPEHEVSLISARGILANIDRSAYELLLVGVDREGRVWLGDERLLEGAVVSPAASGAVAVRWPSHPLDRTLREEATGRVVSPPVDVVFPIIHGAGGEDGTLQGVLALAGISCVGPGVLGSSLAMDKDLTRRVLRQAGIPVIDDVVLEEDESEVTAAIVARVIPLGLPLFVKPARAGSSVGITRLTVLDGLAAALAAARAVDTKVVIERAVLEAREIEVAVLGNLGAEASVPGEIEPHGEFYDYDAKYNDPDSRLLIPAPLDEALTERVRDLALHAYRALDLRGLSRVDFLLSRRDGTLVLNEVNTLPGFTPISMYPRLWEASGVPYRELLSRLIELARRGDRSAANASSPSAVNRR